MSRYINTTTIENSSEQYSSLFDRKKLKFIKQYTTFDFNRLRYFENYNLDTVSHKVEPFDRLYNLSFKYYGTPEYGWLICYTNGLSSEFDITIGMTLQIYYPLDTLLGLL